MIIALTGCKGSGKDQFFSFVEKNFPNLNVRKIAFADPIKDEIINIFNLENEAEYDKFKRTQVSWTLESGQNMPTTLSGRHVVREIGMLMRRADHNQFTRYVLSEIEEDPEALWCITDLRFDNELTMIKALKGIIIKIKRTGADYDGHVTETEFLDEVCTSIIHNDGTIEEYEQKVVKEVNSILATLSIN